MQHKPLLKQNNIRPLKSEKVAHDFEKYCGTKCHLSCIIQWVYFRKVVTLSITINTLNWSLSFAFELLHHLFKLYWAILKYIVNASSCGLFDIYQIFYLRSMRTRQRVDFSEFCSIASVQSGLCLILNFRWTRKCR